VAYLTNRQAKNTAFFFKKLACLGLKIEQLLGIITDVKKRGCQTADAVIIMVDELQIHIISQ
jgi:hypothetical protein